jgi:hypothetical protein
MRLGLVFILLSVLSGSLWGQDEGKDIPKAVQDSFYSRYPDAVGTLWEKQSTTDGSIYHVRFYETRDKRAAVFDSVGQCLQTALYLKHKGTLPQPIVKRLNDRYEAFKVTSIVKLTDKEGIAVYLLRLKHPEGQRLKVRFKADGTILSEEVNPEPTSRERRRRGDR